jgi:hypothetical protein
LSEQRTRDEKFEIYNLFLFFFCSIFLQNNLIIISLIHEKKTSFKHVNNLFIDYQN